MISALVLKVASRCNLNCSYCYIYQHEHHAWRQQPKLMSEATFEAVLRRSCDHVATVTHQPITLIFHGGEPTLIGITRFRRWVVRAKVVMGDHLAGIVLQTNAVRLDAAWAALLHEQQIEVGVSVDGTPFQHDRVRVDHKGQGSYAATLQGIECLQEAGVEPTALCVIAPQDDGAEVYRHLRSIGFERINLLLPDVTHDSVVKWYGAAHEAGVGRYLREVLQAWWSEDCASVSVEPLRGLIAAALGGAHRADAFGNAPQSYLVIETNGEMEALDALHVCAEGITRSGLNILESPFEQIGEGDGLLGRLLQAGAPLSKTCLACSEVSVCGGGYLPHRYSQANGFDNPSVWCADIRAVIGDVRAKISAS